MRSILLLGAALATSGGRVTAPEPGRAVGLEGWGIFLVSPAVPPTVS